MRATLAGESDADPEALALRGALKDRDLRPSTRWICSKPSAGT